MSAAEEFDPQVIATTLMGCVESTFKQMCDISFEGSPEMEEKEIIEYNSRMRVFGPEKFNGPCFIAAINLYLNAKELKKDHTLGAIILYIEESIASEFIRATGQKGLDFDDIETILDYTGEFCNVIVGQFKNELISFGYKDITISAPVKFEDDIPHGVNFAYKEHKHYQISFTYKKNKAIVIDATIAPVPHKD